MGKKIGIALSGGGARGVAHLGVLTALTEFDIKPHVISGTSAGSMVGSFYAGGYRLEDAVDIVKNNDFFGLSNILIRRQGVFNMKNFEKIFLTYFPSNDFKDLKLPLYVTATDIIKGETVYFSSGNLTMALMASSCIPVVFQPIHYDGKLLVDGGVLNNFPVEPLLNQCDVIIGSHCNSFSLNPNDIHMRDMMDRSFHLAMSVPVKNKIKYCNLFFEPPDMSRFSIFDMKKAPEIFAAGYRYALSKEKEIIKLKDSLA